MLKKSFDFLFSLILFLIFSPIFILIWVIVYSQINENPIFYQKRIGKNNKPFTLFKFKSMNNKKNDQGELLPDNQRITKIGKFLRKTSLDELPQLLNIIKGEMSFVGPRPLLPEYLPLYSEIQLKRHDVLPGITGWTQINGRNKLSWSEKFDLDNWYVQNNNFFLDLKIMIRTATKVFKTEDVNQMDDIPMEKFNGKN